MSQVIASGDPVARAVAKQLEYWKDRLLDMSRRNRLLFFKVTKASTAEITHPLPSALFDRLVVKGKDLEFCLPQQLALFDEDADKEETVPVPRELKANEIGVRQTDRELTRVLYNLRSRATTAREEQGVNVLYLAFGFLRWSEAQNEEFALAPLILVPVNLAREAPGRPYKLAMAEEDTVVNPTLRVKLHQDFGLELPDLPNDLDATRMQAYLSAVQSAVGQFPGWGTLSDVVLAIFSFGNLMLVEDLERNKDLFVKHGLIRALGVPGTLIPTPDDLVEKRELDDKVSPADVYQVLDADSSQQEAIEAAKAGLSFILQGPPGTGKSQTIANIIAEFLARGRPILFVSQKIAALEVVQRRLKQVGLSDFCLEIHSHRRNKKDIVSELGASLESLTESDLPEAEPALRQLETVRRRLNAYVCAVHRPRLAMGITAYRVWGELARLKDARDLRFKLTDLEHLSTELDKERSLVLKELASFSTTVAQFSTHPWRGCGIESLSLEYRGEIETTLLRLPQVLEAFQVRIAELAEGYGVATPSTLEEGFELMGVARTFRPHVLSVPVREIRQRSLKRYQSVLRYLYPQYWKDSARLREVSVSQERPNPRTIGDDLEEVIRVQQRVLPPRVDGEAIAAAALPDLRELSQLARQINDTRRFLSRLFSQGEPALVARFYEVECHRLVAWCRDQAGNIGSLGEWVNFGRVRRKADKVGLSSFVSSALRAGLAAEHWEGAFRRRFYLLLSDLLVRTDPILRSFRGSNHDVLISQFRDLDRSHFHDLAPGLVRAHLEKLRPRQSWMQASSADAAILRRELNKKRRLKPLRRLFGEIPELILRLRPCLMMSPLTVSQLLEPELYQFALVIFDEASQVPPEYAAGAILRGHQVVVAGDRHQLPPTRFFQVLESEDVADAEEYEDFESVLNAFDAADLQRKTLLWHYRSRDESLIAFSNYHFYGNKLFTFPSACLREGETGIEFVYVPDGVYRRGKTRDNRVEAQRVVDLVVEHARTHPEQSLGVVTFGIAQADAIQILLDHKLKDIRSIQGFFHEGGPEPFFVKALENVQGDERDVMLFSLGYGRDETGRFLLNFGPLNNPGGERRLNVAVTRARRRVALVASVQPEDIDLSRTSSEGTRLLRSYMMVARDGLGALFRDISVDQDVRFESPFEEAVYDALSARGLQLRTQVGVSEYRIDLGVFDPEQTGRFLLGIECDGRTYHSAATARDRDRLRQEVLEGLGWRMHRIRSQHWGQDEEGEIQKVLHAVEQSKRQVASSLPQGGANTGEPEAEPGHEPPRQRQSSRAGASESKTPLPAGTQPYRRARLRYGRQGIEDFHRTLPGEVVNAFHAIVRDEGPIQISLAKRRAAEAWGLQRIGSRVDQSLDRAIQYAHRQRALERRGSFLWPPRMVKPPVRVVLRDADKRSVDEITLEELAEAAFICVESALSLDEADLIRETGRLFGLRATKKVTDRVKLAIARLVSSGRLELRAEKHRLVRDEVRDGTHPSTVSPVP